MGFFDFFKRGSQEEKETLDKGLEKTKQSFLSKIARAVLGKSSVDDEVLDNLEEVLITSDVGVETTLKIIERIQSRVSRDKVMGTDELQRLLREEIAALLEENNSTNQGQFEIWLNSPDLYSLEIMDLNGRIVKSALNVKMNQGYIIDLSELGSSIYFVRAFSGDKIFQKRVVTIDY